MHIHFFGCSHLYFCCVWLHIALYSSAEVAKCQETSYSGRVRWPHHAMLTLESLLRPHNTLYPIPMQLIPAVYCILLWIFSGGISSQSSELKELKLGMERFLEMEMIKVSFSLHLIKLCGHTFFCKFNV